MPLTRALDALFAYPARCLDIVLASVAEPNAGGLSKSDWRAWMLHSHGIAYDVPQYRGLAERIQRAAVRCRSPHTRLYRGLGLSSAALDAITPGGWYHFPRLSGASPDLAVAIDHAHHYAAVWRGRPVILKIRDPHGVIGAPSPIPDYEVVLPRGARYRVVSVGVSALSIVVLEAERQSAAWGGPESRLDRR